MDRITLITKPSAGYELLESGREEKLERFGDVVLARPDPQALWEKNLPEIQWQNAAGNYPAPDDLTFKAAAAGAEWSKSFYQILTNQVGKDAWPLSGATFVLMQVKSENMAKSQSVLKFVSWAYAKGDKTAEDLDYVPMPASVKTLIEKSWAQIK